MRNYNKKLYQIKMVSGLAFIVVSLFMANNPVMAESPYLPADSSWPAHTPLAVAIENISKTKTIGNKKDNEVQWINHQSSNFDKQSLQPIGKATPAKTGIYNFQHVDTLDVIQMMLPSINNDIDSPCRPIKLAPPVIKDWQHVTKLQNMMTNLVRDPWGNLDANFVTCE